MPSLSFDHFHCKQYSLQRSSYKKVDIQNIEFPVTIALHGGKDDHVYGALYVVRNEASHGDPFLGRLGCADYQAIQLVRWINR